jgi:hypothetical protein
MNQLVDSYPRWTTVGMHHKDEEPMKILQLIAGVEFNGAAQDSCDLSTLIAEREVNEALARGEIPQSPINSALHILHKKEQAVQDYLTQYKMRTGLEYQSVFVGMGAATAVGEKTARKYGYPFIVRAEVARELSVASLGDLQTVVDTSKRTETEFSFDNRIVNLDSAPDRLKALEQLCALAAEHNAKPRSNFVYVEARLYRHFTRDDLERPCGSDDFFKPTRASRPAFRNVREI